MHLAKKPRPKPEAQLLEAHVLMVSEICLAMREAFKQATTFPKRIAVVRLHEAR
jgi:hypothetical protein